MTSEWEGGHSPLKNHRMRILFLVTTLMFVLLAVTGSFAAIALPWDEPNSDMTPLSTGGLPVLADSPVEIVDEPPVTAHAIALPWD